VTDIPGIQCTHRPLDSRTREASIPSLARRTEAAPLLHDLRPLTFLGEFALGENFLLQQQTNQRVERLYGSRQIAV
jgi:hypothetical protein